MQSKQEGQFITARLEDGADYLNSLKKIAKKHDIKAGFIVNSIGMLKEIELGFFQGKGKYKINKFEGPMECVSTQGNFATKDGELKTHVHVTLADDQSSARGGHLEKGIVNVTAELLILKLDKTNMTRKIEQATGLAGLKIG